MNIFIVWFTFKIRKYFSWIPFWNFTWIPLLDRTQITYLNHTGINFATSAFIYSRVITLFFIHIFLWLWIKLLKNLLKLSLLSFKIYAISVHLIMLLSAYHLAIWQGKCPGQSLLLDRLSQNEDEYQLIYQ